MSVKVPTVLYEDAESLKRIIMVSKHALQRSVAQLLLLMQKSVNRGIKREVIVVYIKLRTAGKQNCANSKEFN